MTTHSYLTWQYDMMVSRRMFILCFCQGILPLSTGNTHNQKTIVMIYLYRSFCFRVTTTVRRGVAWLMVDVRDTDLKCKVRVREGKFYLLIR